VNFQAGGRFSAVGALVGNLVDPPPIPFLVCGAKVSPCRPRAGNISSPWVTGVETAFKGFVTNIVVAKLTPLACGFSA